MTYEKPSMLVLASAIQAVQASDKGDNIDSAVPPQLTGAAYEVDE